MNTTVSELNAITNAKREQRLANGEKQKQKRKQKQPAPLRAQLRCEGCGATVDAACPCGKPYAYVPAGEVAAKAIEANPEKSDRAIAKMVGVHHDTVSETRKKLTGGNPPVEEKRVGLDGKARRSPKRRQPEHKKGSIPPEQEYLDRVEKAIALAKVPYKGEVTDQTAHLAMSVIVAWGALMGKFREQLEALN
jgi:hypothetical protein